MVMDTGEEAKGATISSRFSVEGDGVASGLFELLWKRDLRTQTSLSLRIPDTVIYKYNFPSVWYFTSIDGSIKRKSKQKLNVEHIFKEFTKKPAPCGVVAYFVLPEPDSSDNGRTSGTIVEYFDAEGLRDFLFNRMSKGPTGAGILQRFIEPRGERNSMMRALWSPKVCILERRVNRLPLRDTRYDMYERLVTFEGSDFQSENTPVRGPALVTKVHEIADSIVHHVASVTQDVFQISRLALNFKVDEKDNLWLLFASSVRTKCSGSSSRSLLRQAETMNKPIEVDAVMRVPEHVRRSQSTRSLRPASIHPTCSCPTCGQQVKEDCMFHLSYKVLLDSRVCPAAHRHPAVSSKGPRERCGRQWTINEEAPSSTLRRLSSAPELRHQGQVPAVMQRIHPRMSAEEFMQLRDDVAFLSRTIDVCETCFLDYTETQLSEPAPHPRHRHHAARASSAHPESDDEEGAGGSEDGEQFRGMQELNPQRLRDRREMTQGKIEELRAAEDDRLDGQARRRRQCGSAPARSRSCPKLPHWGSDGRSLSLQPPAPVLAMQQQPRPPRGAPPGGLPPRPQSLELLEQTSPQRSSPGPARRQNPYLKELQAFAACSGSRALQVLGPCAVDRALSSAAAPPQRHGGDAHADDVEAEEAQVAAPKAAAAPGPGWKRCAVCGQVFENFAALNAHSMRVHGHKGQVWEPSAAAAGRPPSRKARSKSSDARPPPLSSAHINSNDVKGSDAVQSETPTTALPNSRPTSSSYMNSRPSTRPSSSGAAPGPRLTAQALQRRTEMLQRTAQALQWSSSVTLGADPTVAAAPAVGDS